MRRWYMKTVDNQDFLNKITEPADHEKVIENEHAALEYIYCSDNSQ